MTDAELRALVRDAVARHLGPAAARRVPQDAGPQVPSPVPAPAAVRAAPAVAAVPMPSHECASHPSHHVYVSLVNTDTACVIEPSVGCDHCGYCRSHGH
jgi:hypothetical protein